MKFQKATFFNNNKLKKGTKQPFRSVKIEDSLVFGIYEEFSTVCIQQEQSIDYYRVAILLENATDQHWT